MSHGGLRRGATNEASAPNDDVEHEVQFVTPYYNDDSGPEPLDLSKLCLDDDDLFEKDDSEEEEVHQTETRGRSRSRSVHENDLGANGYIPPDVVGENQKQKASQTSSQAEEKPNRRGGPLQQKEIQALRKGLEEANQSINKNHNREEEEERMAADAEKRKRLLMSNSSLHNNDAAARRVKILMLGDSGVGKSSLILRWTMDTFSPSLVSTVGVNFKSRKVNVASEVMQVQVWDTAGQEQFHKITTSYYKGAQGIMLVYDVTDQTSLANVEYWIKNIKSHASDSVQVALIGNKTDLRNSNTDPNKKSCETERGQEVAHKFGIPFFETSAKDSFNVDIAFLTLVEHIVDNGSGGSGASTAGTGVPGSGIGATVPQNGGLERRSIVEKKERTSLSFPNLTNTFKRSSVGGTSPPVPPSNTANGTAKPPGPPFIGVNGAPAGSPGATAGTPGENGVGGENGDKEKCIIS